MFSTTADYRAAARESLKGKWNESALYYFVYALITSGLSLVFALATMGSEIYSNVSSLAVTVICIPLQYAVIKSFLRQLRGENIELGWLFKEFNLRIWSTIILKYIYTILWSLLLFVPGIIKYYSYAMTEYILADNPEMKNNEAIELSMTMMDGYKWRLFLLDLSFLGWLILSIFTLCIGLFWLEPYMMSARAAFYEERKKEYEQPALLPEE